ncbi:MAG: 2-amino-4-hydroxy-6-hydroxymethyldihydropteridine diphosphokinase [Zoogloeaceae bacterium]|jgi:2-amino-4-hydroxy-6-hydroxymethyldihydropteridine diphosphokinase|nr:2-amino-4-hydroxy-6-hydroxymethyldihydropteridine diphosphokinase [Zoogloeaceae bacterium]
MNRAYVALGANLGEACRTVRNALAALDGLPRTRLLAASSLYRTAPVGFPAQPDFINAVAALDTALPPLDLLAALQAEEAAQGRRRSIPNAPRTLDLDLLLYADLVMRAPALRLPHPRLHLRAFVLVPLAEIAPAGLDIPGRGTLSAWLPAVATQRVSRL